MDNRCSRIPKWERFSNEQLVNIARYYLFDDEDQQKAIEVLNVAKRRGDRDASSILERIGTVDLSIHEDYYFFKKLSSPVTRDVALELANSCHVISIVSLLRYIGKSLSRDILQARYFFITGGDYELPYYDDTTLFAVGRELEGHPNPSYSMQNAINFYLDTTHAARRSALHTILCLRAIGICRDVAVLIGRAVFKENILLIKEGLFCFAND